jgi:hypothetical protein
MSVATKIDRAIDKMGSTVVLKYKPNANEAEGGDWPNPDDPPTAPPPLDRTIKAIMAPQSDVENQRSFTPEGELPRELVQAVFKATEDLNDVEKVVWQGNEYTIQYGDTYELSDEKLAQVVILLRTRATVLQPHA